MPEGITFIQHRFLREPEVDLRMARAALRKTLHRRPHVGSAIRWEKAGQPTGPFVPFKVQNA
jgi:hypothetical protein